ncbi:MAG: hypothetical protein Q8T08_01620 [Ignavibacteria bacterium]|nr:hypothetical protein [Ignavibacteria bacterium]
MKITARDKMLLKWLGLFFILFMIYQFVYLPIQNNLSEKESKLAELLTQKEYTQATLPTYDDVLKTEDETRLLVLRKFNSFFDEFSADAVEAYLYPLFDQYEGNINYFQTSLTQVVVPEVLVNEKEVLNYKLKLLVDEYEKNVTETKEALIASSDLLKTSILYRLDISFTNYQLLIQELSELETNILLTSASYVFKDGVANIEFDVYSLKKFSVTP